MNTSKKILLSTLMVTLSGAMIFAAPKTSKTTTEGEPKVQLVVPGLGLGHEKQVPAGGSGKQKVREDELKKKPGRPEKAPVTVSRPERKPGERNPEWNKPWDGQERKGRGYGRHGRRRGYYMTPDQDPCQKGDAQCKCGRPHKNGAEEKKESPRNPRAYVKPGQQKDKQRGWEGKGKRN